MFERFKRYRQIHDVATDIHINTYKQNDRLRRSLIPIAVIDDQPFKPEQNLRNVGYDIHYVGDIKSLDEVIKYNIILCDLQGVGRFLNSKGQGAFIIDELKRNHPEKFVIAYTGGSMDDAITLRAQEVADLFIRKDADIDEWRDKLDSIIGFLCDPVAVWKRQRLALVDADVPTFELLKLEDAFVASIQAKDDSKYRQLLTSDQLNGDLRAIAQSLVASGIFKLLVG